MREVSDTRVFDEAQLLARVEGDVELRTEIVDLFLDRLPELEGELVRAVDSAEGERVKAAAHKIQGALISISANAAAGTALSLERAARGQEISELPAKLERLRGELKRLKETLTHVRAHW